MSPSYNLFRTPFRSRSKYEARRSQLESADAPFTPSGVGWSWGRRPSTSSQVCHSSLEDHKNRLPSTLNANFTNADGSGNHGKSKPTTRSRIQQPTTGTHSTITSLATPTQTMMSRSDELNFGGGSGSGDSGRAGVGNGGAKPTLTSSRVDLDLPTQRSTSTSAPSPPTSPPPDSNAVSSPLSATDSKQPTSTPSHLPDISETPATNSHRSSFESRSQSNTNSPIPLSRASSLPSTSPRPPSPLPLPSDHADISPNLSSQGHAHDVRAKEKKRRSVTFVDYGVPGINISRCNTIPSQSPPN